MAGVAPDFQSGNAGLVTVYVRSDVSRRALVALGDALQSLNHHFDIRGKEGQCLVF